MLLGGGKLGRRRRHHVITKGFLKTGLPDLHLSDKCGIRDLIPDFDPELEFEYSQRELLLLAEKILIEDPKPFLDEPMVLNYEMYIRRSKREVYTSKGTPDPSIMSGMYWRTHPNGRRISKKNRRNDQAFYSD